ncbi:hypothetical protein BCR34DRAFT_619900 [Clohesyomyces aquaticus]|uniref:Uncharacterized protein n=1 Tax=Clohesyomyces aquaticus TaxID=1231657 RepID=A0A1Y1YC25_9PLEO|nr:hypothetical protein BCR34DRAFT_619900 [Clohesyomyces aquaticus]
MPVTSNLGIMSAPTSNPATAKNLPQKYQEFVEKANSKFFHLGPLHNFLSSQCPIKSKIHVVIFKKGQTPAGIELEQDSAVLHNDLATWLKRDRERQLYLVEDLSPHTAKLLGGYLDINPQFFADYIDMVIPSPSNPKTSDRDIQPAPWFRMGNIAYHLPSLRSLEDRKDYVFTQFIGPREYHPPTDYQSEHATLGDRPKADTKNTNIERVAGGHDPVQLSDRKVWPVAMTRHSAAAWFGESPSGTAGGWLKGESFRLFSSMAQITDGKAGVILLDRPFESTHESLKRQNSIYRSFTHLPSSMHTRIPQVSDLRDTYLTSLLHSFQANEQLQQDAPSPIAILQDVYRIVASEWIAVSTYLERDLNAIEWQLEAKDKTPDLDLLEERLKSLFIMRRRNRKYKALVDEQLQLRFPTHWTGAGPAAAATDSVRAAMEADFKQVQDLIYVGDSGEEVKHAEPEAHFSHYFGGNRASFNTLGAILGMQTDYAPEKAHWHFFLRLSFGAAGGIITVYLFVVFWDRIRRIFRKQ